MQFLEYLESIQVEESGALLLVKECGGARLAIPLLRRLHDHPRIRLNSRRTCRRNISTLSSKSFRPPLAFIA
jgi:hypothetical protein